MNNKQIKIIIEIIDKVLTTEMELGEFYSIWPESLEGDALGEELFDIIESAIEHQPGSFFTNCINLDEWQNSNGYKALMNLKKKLTYQLD